MGHYNFRAGHNLGAHLLEITTKVENDFINNWRSSKGAAHSHAYLGKIREKYEDKKHSENADTSTSVTFDLVLSPI